ncbi:MAG: hypothetical protein SGJ27_30775 [Candidatus Melainabacteria bacterium]|nr:hypothetical protein [Candidatus Melainabacteria bacterium]
MKLLIVAALVFCIIAVIAVVRSRKKNTAVTPVGTAPVPTSTVVPVSRLSRIPESLAKERLEDDSDDDKYWRRYYR